MAKRIKVAEANPLFTNVDPSAIGLTDRRPPQNTLPISKFGLVTIGEEYLAVVSIPHNQILYVKYRSHGISTDARKILPKLSIVLGNNAAAADILTFNHHLRHPEDTARLVQFLLEQKPDYSLDGICDIISSLSSYRPAHTNEVDERERQLNKAEYWKLISLIQVQPQFDAARDSVRLSSPTVHDLDDKKLEYVLPPQAPQTAVMDPVWANGDMPSQMVYHQLSKHVDWKRRTHWRTLSAQASRKIRMYKKRLPLALVTEENISLLERILGNTEVIVIEVQDIAAVDPGKWAVQKNAWRILMLPQLMNAFCQVGVLILTGAIAGDMQFYEFLSTLLAHAECKLKAIRFEGYIALATLREDAFQTGNLDKVQSYETMLTDAIAANRSVLEFDLDGPYRSRGSIMKTWLDGLARRTNIEIFKYDGIIDDFNVNFKMHTPVQAIIAVLTSNLASLQLIDLRLGFKKRSLLRAFYDKFMQDPKNSEKEFTIEYYDDAFSDDENAGSSNDSSSSSSSSSESDDMI
jgi:hypothetical protein